MGQELLIGELIDAGVLKSPSLVKAFWAIDRRDFVTAENLSRAYTNQPLPTFHGQTISQPWTVAFMLELLEPKPGEKILDIGAGSGWQAALLGWLVGHDEKGEELQPNLQGYVLSLESVPEICDFGRKNLNNYGYLKKGLVEYHCLNARQGFAAEAPYDKIISAAALEDSDSKVLVGWLGQLKIGGRLVTPVGSKIRLIKKIGKDDFEQKDFEGFIFVPLV